MSSGEPPTAGAPPATGPALRWLEAGVIGVATALAYANSFDAAFHFDDYGIVLREGAPGLPWPPVGSRWLGELTFALNRVAGGSLAGFHALNLAIHVAAAILVATLAASLLRAPAASADDSSRLLRERLPLAAGLLFALHPLATQAVTYVVQRFTSLATLLYLLAVVLFLRARLLLERDGRLSGRALAQAAGAAVAAVGAMKTKEISVTLPAAVLGVELLFFRGRRAAALVLWAPLLAAAFLPFLEPGLGERLATEAPLPRWSYALTQTRVVVTYLRLLAWPAGQNVDHDVTLSTSLGDPAVLASLLVILAVLGVGAWLIHLGRRDGRAGALLAGGGIAWFFLTLSVESSVVPIRDVMFEHRVYLPSVGAAIAAATGLLLALERVPVPGPPAARTALALALLAGPLGLATHLRNRVWRDDVTLWSDAVSKSPGKARPHQMLGEARAQRGEHDAAVREYLAALRLSPRYLDPWFNLGQSYLALGDLERALLAFDAAAQASPGYAMAHNNRGAVLQRLGRLDAAEQAYLEALRVDPALAAAQGNLARLRQVRANGTAPSP